MQTSQMRDNSLSYIINNKTHGYKIINVRNVKGSRAMAGKRATMENLSTNNSMVI
jgi:hypothetical protein